MTHFRNIAAGLRPRRSGPLSGAATLLFALAGAASAQPTPGEVVTEAHGDWLTRCFETDVTPRCALTQYVIAEDLPGTELRVAVWRGLEAGDGLQVIAPLGVALRPGITLWIDPDGVDGAAAAVEVGTIPFETCRFDGCAAQVVLDANTLTLLRAGSTAVFVFYLDGAPEQAIGIPISLIGFTAGFDALQE